MLPSMGMDSSRKLSEGTEMNIVPRHLVLIQIYIVMKSDY